MTPTNEQAGATAVQTTQALTVGQLWQAWFSNRAAATRALYQAVESVSGPLAGGVDLRATLWTRASVLLERRDAPPTPPQVPVYAWLMAIRAHLLETPRRDRSAPAGHMRPLPPTPEAAPAQRPARKRPPRNKPKRPDYDVEALLARTTAAELATLTDSQREIVEMMQDGATVMQAARSLGISHAAARERVDRACSRLQGESGEAPPAAELPVLSDTFFSGRPERWRSVYMRRREGMSWRAIASELDLSRDAVKAIGRRLRRALEQPSAS